MSAFIRARTTSSGARRYDVRYRRGGRAFPLEHAGTFTTEREAKIRLRRVQDWLADGRNPKVELARQHDDRQTVGQLAADWITGRHDIDTTTRAAYLAHIDHITRHVGSLVAPEVQVQDVQRFVATIAATLAPGSVAGVVGTLRMILDATGDPVNPARSRQVRLPRKVKHTVEPPDAVGVLAMLRAINRRYLPHAVLLEHTGLRVTELLGLRAGDVDRPGERVRIRGETSKRDRPRWVAVDGRLLDELELPLAGSRQVVHHAIVRACEKAGVRGFHTHDLRHRRASLWHQQGVPAVELARRLGHSRPSVSLDVYSHVMPLDEVEVHDLVLLLSRSDTSSRLT